MITDVEILYVLANHQDWMTIPEICEVLGRSWEPLHTQLARLMRQGYVEDRILPPTVDRPVNTYQYKIIEDQWQNVLRVIAQAQQSQTGQDFRPGWSET